MREYAQIRLAIWNDDDFTDLTPPAQLLYFMLISHPTLNKCGVGDWRPGRLTAWSPGWNRPMIEAAAAELIDKLFILIDEDTEEFLVRTYVRHDGFMKQRNMATSMARDYATVGSKALKGVIVWELQKLKRECPELKGWESSEAFALTTTKVGIDPSTYPSGNPSVDPSVKGSVNPSTDPSVDPSPTPTPTPHTFTSRGESLVPFVQEDASEAETTPPQNLDQLAAAHAAAPPMQGQGPFGTPDDPRCAEHALLEVAPPCGKCAQAREAFARQEDAAKRKQQQIIDDCDYCDDNGKADVGDGGAPLIVNCNHIDPPRAPEREPEAKPDVDLDKHLAKVRPFKTQPEPRPESTQDDEQPENNPAPTPLPKTGTGPF